MVDVASLPAGPRVREWAQKHRMSPWIVARLVRLTDHPTQLLEGLIKRPPTYLRLHPRRLDHDEIRKRLIARGFKMATSDLDPNVVRIRERPMSPGATIEHLRGYTTPQDLASASAGLALDPQPGERIADLATAPGVKTLHIADMMDDAGAIVAVEPDEARMRGLRFNLERCGVTSAVTRQETAQEIPGEAWADRVLVDAPCTGEGTMPKDRHRRMGQPEEIAAAAKTQSEILDAADRILRPGGTLVYATCTFAPEENEGQVQQLLDRGYVIEPLPFDSCGGVQLVDGVTEWPTLELDESLRATKRFLPGIHPTLGFYVAKLRKVDA